MRGPANAKIRSLVYCSIHPVRAHLFAAKWCTQNIVFRKEFMVNTALKYESSCVLTAYTPFLVSILMEFQR